MSDPGERSRTSEADSVDSIDLSVSGSVATITIRRPEKRNAVTADMVRALVARVGHAGADDAVKCIVLRGEGAVFCSGYDVSDPRDFEGAPGEPTRSRIASVREKAGWMRDLLTSTKPLIVSAQGACAGIGTYFVLVADFAIATQDAGFGLPEERFGSAGTTWAYPFLIREVGLKRANEMVMTGRRFDADEALAMGILNRVVANDEQDDATADLATAISTLPREGIALNRAVKQLALSVTGHLGAFEFHPATHPLAEQMRREPDELDFMALVARDGMRAAVEERNRRFAGGWWGW
jgi:enoyl-CoA hydratase/carnithine racemase